MGNPNKILSARIILQLLVFIVLVPLLPLLISWKWDWWQARACGFAGLLPGIW